MQQQDPGVSRSTAGTVCADPFPHLHSSLAKLIDFLHVAGPSVCGAASLVAKHPGWRVPSCTLHGQLAPAEAVHQMRHVGQQDQSREAQESCWLTTCVGGYQHKTRLLGWTQNPFMQTCTVNMLT